MILEIYDKDTRKRVDLIRVYTFVQYTEEYNSYGRFSLIIYPEDLPMEYIVFGNYILFERINDRNIVGIIKGKRNYEDDNLQIEVYGYLCNVILTYRYFLLTTKYNALIVDIVVQMFKDLFIESERPERNIDFLKISPNLPEINDKITVQNTGDNFLDVFNKKIAGYGLGIDLIPIIENHDEERGKIANLDSFELNISQFKDRSVGNKEGNKPVLFSFELNNLTELTYEEDGRAYVSTVIVAGQGEGQDRRLMEIGDSEKTGIDRIELYVDARDLQSEEEFSDEMTYETTRSFLSSIGNYDIQTPINLISYTDTSGYLDSEISVDIQYGDNVMDYSSTLTILNDKK